MSPPGSGSNDVRDQASIESFAEAATESIGRIDILVNNAGCNVRKPSVEISWDDYLRDRIPLKRPGAPNDLDGAVVFLASDASEYVTGQNLLIDGGISTGATRALPKKKD